MPGSWRLDGRVALITGAQRGIGFACAEAFVAAGASVACIDLPGGELGPAVERLGPAASAHPTDIADIGAAADLVAGVVARHGRLDVLVNAAGTLAPAPFLEMTAEQWDHTLGVNTRGTLFLAQACARHFVSAGVSGRIILFASIVGRSVVRPNNTAYSASKAAIIQAARCLALELAPHAITVNTISPGLHRDRDAGRGAGPRRRRVDHPWQRRRMAPRHPARQARRPADQAALAVFLAGDGARHITGQDIAVDGGQTVV